MKVCDLIKELNLKEFTPGTNTKTAISGCFVSDLLSYVIGNAGEGTVWITLQTHKNIAAVATLKDLAAIILIGDHKPDEDTVRQAFDEDLPILGSRDEAFELSGKIYNLLQK